MPLDTTLKKNLRAKAHKLNPVVLIGSKGLTDAVLAEIDTALNSHELIKIKASGVEREQREAIAKQICDQLTAEFVQQIGGILVIYRKKIEQKK